MLFFLLKNSLFCTGYAEIITDLSREKIRMELLKSKGHPRLLLEKSARRFFEIMFNDGKFEEAAEFAEENSCLKTSRNLNRFLKVSINLD